MFKSTYLGESYWFDNFEEVKDYYNHPEAADADELNSILKAEAEGMESPVISEI